jgi:competence protein ComEC
VKERLHQIFCFPSIFPANQMFLLAYFLGLALSLMVHSWLLVTITGLAVAAAFVLVLQSKKGPTVLLFIFLCLGVFMGSMRLETLKNSILDDLKGKRVAVEATVTGPPKEKGVKESFFAKATSLSYLGKQAEVNEDILVEIFCPEQCAENSLPSLEEGRLLRIEGTIADPPSTPGSDFDFGLYLRRRGVNAVLTAHPDCLEVLAGRRGGWRGVVDAARHYARSSLEKGGWGPAGLVERGMVIGDADRVPDEIISDFRDSGLLHLLAVSGQNVVLLGFVVSLICRALLVPRLASTLIAALVICVYVPLTGAGPSIVRAVVVGG